MNNLLIIFFILFLIQSGFGQSDNIINNDTLTNPDKYKIKGFQSFYNEDYESALHYFSKAIELNEKDTISYKQRGLINHKLGNLQNAINDYTIAIELTPTDVNLYLNRGAALQMVNKNYEAISDCKIGITLDSNNQTLHNNLAWAYYRLEMVDSACIYWNKARELGREFSKSFFKDKCESNNTNEVAKKYKVIDFSSPSVIKIDTTIFIDGTVSNDTNIKTLKDSALFNYYSKHIVSPPHGGDPNYATVSFIIDTLGHVIYVYIIEDVMNKTNDEPWKWLDDKGFQFSPLIVNSKPYIVEYQIKIDDLCYCAPLIYKEHTARKRKEKRKRE